MKKLILSSLSILVLLMLGQSVKADAKSDADKAYADANYNAGLAVAWWNDLSARTTGANGNYYTTLGSVEAAYTNKTIDKSTYDAAKSCLLTADVIYKDILSNNDWKANYVLDYFDPCDTGAPTFITRMNNGDISYGTGSFVYAKDAYNGANALLQDETTGLAYLCFPDWETRLNNTSAPYGYNQWIASAADLLPK